MIGFAIKQRMRFEQTLLTLLTLREEYFFSILSADGGVGWLHEGGGGAYPVAHSTRITRTGGRMARFALVCAAAISLTLIGACAREPDPARQDAPVNDAAAPPPPLTTEMVGGSDPAVQPTAVPAATPQSAAPVTPAPSSTTAPATAPAPAADTSHAAHADSGHTGGH
jgi:hypothetical protein